ncbi:MAG: STAS domain-containing protein [Acidimicrobiia bacterium]
MLSDQSEQPSLEFQSRGAGILERPRALVTLSGEIDLVNGDSVVEQLLEVANTNPRVTVDLHDVTFMGAQGVNACLAAQRRARAMGCDVRFANPQGIVARVIEVVGLESVLLAGSDDER